MRGDFEISEMTLDDLGEVCRIESEVFPNPWPESSFEADVRNESAYSMVVRDSANRIVGYTCMMFIVDEAHLTNIAVSIDHRRRGIGSMLMDDLISRAESRGCRVILLEVRLSNHAAISFYSRYGFVEMYRRKQYYRNPVEDALVLVRRIGERNSNG